MIEKRIGGRQVLLTFLLLLPGGSLLAQRSNDANVQAEYDLQNARRADAARRLDSEAARRQEGQSSSSSPFSSEPDYEICWNGARVRSFDLCPPYVTLEEEEAARLEAIRREVEGQKLRQAEEARLAETDEQRRARLAREYEEQRAAEASQLEADRIAEERHQRLSREQQLAREEQEERQRQENIADYVRRSETAKATFAEDRARLAAGNCQARNDDAALAGAVQRARNLVRLQPTNLTVREELASSLQQAKQYKAALSELDRVIELRGFATQTNYSSRAQLLANMGRWEEAFRDKRLSGFATEHDLEGLQAAAARANGDYATAIRHLEKMDELHPGTATLSVVEAYWHAGRQADALAKLDEAIDGNVEEMIRWHARVETFCPAQ